MLRVTLALALALAAAAPGLVSAQGLDLLGTTATGPVSVGSGSAGEAPAGGSAAAASAADERVLLKLQRNEPLTEVELVAYLRMIEALNPWATWQQVASKLHDHFYRSDTQIEMAGLNLGLMKDGPENAGFEKVTLPPGGVPKFMVDRQGNKVDAAHAFTGARALVNRGTLKGEFMGNVNTGWGDSVQVVGERIKAAGNYVVGAFSDYQRSYRAMDAWSNAPRFKPPDQVRGNELGMAVNRWLRSHRGARLSEAFDAVLNPPPPEPAPARPSLLGPPSAGGYPFIF